MNLEPFGWALGISDIKNYRECPQRFVHSMRRHVTLPERLQLTPGETDEPPGSTNWTNSYGSAIHHAIHLVDQEDVSHDDAIDECLKEYGTYLGPEDVQLLRDDLAQFERRRPTGVTIVASERDMRVPLFVHEGQQYYFRFKLDVLYRLIANPAIFLHRDYKSSRWRRTPAEVHSDEQLWCYNWAIHELYPECTRLLQTYDQLKFGEVPTSKNDQQRAEMKQWLIAQVKVILADDTYIPKQNDWCRYCPLVVTCRETHRATQYWRGRMSILAPLTKEGRKTKAAFIAEGMELERIVKDELPKMQQTRKHLELVEELLKELIRDMPIEERERLGWAVKDRKSKELSADGLKALYEMMGEPFWQLIALSMTKFDDMVGKPKRGEPVPPELELVRSYQTEKVSGTNVVPAKSA